MQWRTVLVIRGPQGTERRTLDGDTILIGRTAPADVVLESVRVSRSHVRLGIDANGRVTARDAGSTGGTYRRGYQVRGTIELAVGDELEVGDFVISLAERPLLVR